MTTEVTLDAQCEAHFPDRCILCGSPGPGDTLDEPLRATTLRSLLGLGGPPPTLKVPACAHCRGLLERQRHLRSRGSIVAIAAAGLAYAALLVFYQGPYVHFVRTGGLVLFLAPYVIWEGLFPLPFRLRTSSRHVVYVFEQNDYGREFALINPDVRDYYLDELVEQSG